MERKQIRQIEINQRGLQHSLKIIVRILMILTILHHKNLKVKHLTQTKLRVLKRVKEHLEQVAMLGTELSSVGSRHSGQRYFNS